MATTDPQAIGRLATRLKEIVEDRRFQEAAFQRLTALSTTSTDQWGQFLDQMSAAPFGSQQYIALHREASRALKDCCELSDQIVQEQAQMNCLLYREQTVRQKLFKACRQTTSTSSTWGTARDEDRGSSLTDADGVGQSKVKHSNLKLHSHSVKPTKLWTDGGVFCREPNVAGRNQSTVESQDWKRKPRRGNKVTAFGGRSSHTKPRARRHPGGNVGMAEPRLIPKARTLIFRDPVGT